MSDRLLRIGCGAAFWGDSNAGAAQLVKSGKIDVLVLDYLAEITMSILSRARKHRPELGYATDFVDGVMSSLAFEIEKRRIKVIANAGGVNPIGCRDALEALLRKLDVSLKVAVVVGDDVSDEIPALRAMGHGDLESGRELPSEFASANAYLGAFPIAEALRQGADVVITGRSVDSALALGPLIAEFDWKPEDLDRLAGGSLAGHVIECGVQATGGIFTDWESVAGGWADMGFPIVECASDGSFVATKPEGTGGLVSTRTIAEQIVYEVHDPARYLLPDVTCDFSEVALEQVGKDRVRVSGARGLPPPPDYKASVTYADGFRCTATVLILGIDAPRKARSAGEAILARAGRLAAEAGLGDFRRTSIEVMGTETYYGARARSLATREVILKLGATHADQRALEILAREIAPAATAMSPGLTGLAGGRPNVQPMVRLASCLVPKQRINAEVVLGASRTRVPCTPVEAKALEASRTPSEPSAPPASDSVMVPLIQLAHGRSGDKGNTANIGILAREPEFLPVIAAALTPEAVKSYLSHLVEGEVTRHYWPGLQGYNFVLRGALGGGGTSSLRYDPQGKGLAQILLDFEIPVPKAWLETNGPLSRERVRSRALQSSG
jgi:hypothetical protein